MQQTWKLKKPQVWATGHTELAIRKPCPIFTNKVDCKRPSTTAPVGPPDRVDSCSREPQMINSSSDLPPLDAPSRLTETYTPGNTDCIDSHTHPRLTATYTPINADYTSSQQPARVTATYNPDTMFVSPGSVTHQHAVALTRAKLPVIGQTNHKALQEKCHVQQH